MMSLYTFLICDRSFISASLKSIFCSFSLVTSHLPQWHPPHQYQCQTILKYILQFHRCCPLQRFLFRCKQAVIPVKFFHSYISPFCLIEQAFTLFLYQSTKRTRSSREDHGPQYPFMCKQNDKPGYVVNDHLSSTAVASRIKRPT